MSKKLSNGEVKKIQNRLIVEVDELTQTIEDLKKDDPFLDPDRTSDNAAIDTDVREEVGHETIEAQVASLNKKLNLVKAAIVKIEKGKYGPCESCKDPINAARLELIPEARYCIVCERRLVK